MKKILLTSFLALGVGISAQVTGTKTIGTDYATLADAFADLNTNGVGSGGVTLNVPSGYTEVAPAGGYVLGTATLNATLSATSPLIIQKSGSGAKPVFTGSVGIVTPGSSGDATADAIFKFVGVDYVTLDGITIQESTSNSDVASMNERALAFYNLTATDGCQYNTIKNNSIIFHTQVNNYAYGIWLGHYNTAGTAVNPTDVTGTHSYNKIYSNTITKAQQYAIRLAGYNSATYYDRENEVGGSTAGAGNTIQLTGSADDNYAFLNATAISIAYQNALNVSNNSITTGTGGFGNIGIFLTSIASSSATVNNNTIVLTDGFPLTGYTNYHAGIYNTGATSTLTANKNNISILGVTGSASTVAYGIYQGATGAFTANGNTVTSGTTTYGFQGIYSASTGAVEINENTIGGTTASTANSANAFGIYLAATGTTANVIKNKIYNLTTASSTGVVAGLYVAANTANSTLNIANNLIGDLKAPVVSATSVNLAGIYFAASTNNATYNVFYNTIYLNGTSSGTNFSSSGIYHTYANSTTISALNLRNNIIVNTSTPKGTGIASAYRRSASTNLNNYLSTDANNNFYVTSGNSSSFLYYAGTTGSNTPAGIGTVYAYNPVFITTNGTSADFLHVNENAASNQDIDNKGVTISGYTADFDGTTRSATTPDLGADEFAYTAPTTAPGCTTITSPVSGSTNVYPGTVNIAWNAVSGAAAYKVYVGSTSGATDIINGTSVNNTNYDLSAPTSFSTYYVKVVPYNSAGDAVGCDNEINFKTTYCQITGSSVFPITKVTLNGTSETSSLSSIYVDLSNNNTPSFEVRKNNSYTVDITAGATTTASQVFATAIFVDWNQDGDFDDAGEQYFNTAGSLIYGSGASSISLSGSISVPATALSGNTRMRVKHNYNTNNTSISTYLATACAAMLNGQVKDYTIEVKDYLAVSDVNKANNVSVYPNPFTDVLKISDIKGVKSISVNDMSGRQVKTLAPSAEINLSSLKQGLYIVNLQMEDGTVKSLKAIKK